MEYKLEKLKLLAVGGQAEIYEVDDSRVLRVLRGPEHEEQLKAEYEITKTLKEAGLDVPEVYECLIADGRPALLVERIKGVPMMEALLKSPFSAFRFVKRLARLHCEILNVRAPESFTDIKKRAALLTNKAGVLSDREKEFVQSLISQVPEGDSLCHGDFHPGNILLSGKRHCVIDWHGATKGVPVSDIAHTYLLIKSAPKAPGISGFQRAVIKITGRALALGYLKAMRKAIMFSDEEFSKWLVIRAAERSFYGIEGEKEERARFIGKCLKKIKDIKNWRRFV